MKLITKAKKKKGETKMKKNYLLIVLFVCVYGPFFYFFSYETVAFYKLSQS